MPLITMMIMASGKLEPNFRTPDSTPVIEKLVPETWFNRKLPNCEVLSCASMVLLAEVTRCITS